MNKYLTAGLLFLAFLLVYYAGSFDKIPFADCMGFVLTTEKGNFETVATSTTHLLYSNTTILIKNITGLDAIEANRALVIFSGAMTVVMIFLTLCNLTRKQWIAIVSAVVFGFSFTFWKNAEIVEVYTYNALLLMFFYYCIINSFLTVKNKYYIVFSGFFLGISIWLHIQNFLLIPAFLLFLYYFRKEKSVWYSLFIFIAIFSSIFILNSLQGFSLSSPFKSGQGNWVEDSFKKDFKQYAFDFIKSLGYLVYNFNVFVIVGIVGMILLYKKNSKMFYVFFVAAVMMYGFATFYAVSDNYVFFMPFNIIFALSIGYGLTSEKFIFFKKFSWTCIFIPLIYYFSFLAASSTPQGKAFNDFKDYKGGLSYYLLPWMNDNKGILEFIIEGKTAPEAINWMEVSASEYIEIMKKKGYSEEEIKKL